MSLKDTNKANFSDTPVASEQQAQSQQVNTNPIKINRKSNVSSTQAPMTQQAVDNLSPDEKSQRMPVPGIKVVGGRGRGRNRVPGVTLTPTYGDIAETPEVQSEIGYGTSGTELGNSVYQPVYGDEYFDSKWMGISFGSVNDSTSNLYTGLNDQSKYVDFEHLRRNSQSTTGALANTVTQFAGKTLVNTVGGIVGGFYSLGAAGVQGVKNAFIDDDKETLQGTDLLFDNSVNRGLDKATEWVDQNNSVFTSQKARDENGILGFNIETLKGLSDGFSFIAGAILSEMATGGMASLGIGSNTIKLLGASKYANSIKNGALTAINVASSAVKKSDSIGGYLSTLKAASKAVKGSQELLDLMDDGSKLAKTMSKAERAALLETRLASTGMNLEQLATYSNAIQKYNNIGSHVRSTITGTFWEAGLEARQAKDEFIANNLDKELMAIDERQDLTEKEKIAMKNIKRKEIEDLASRAGLLSFGLNVSVLKASNIIQFPTIFGTPSKLTSTSFKGAFKTLPDGTNALKNLLTSKSKNFTKKDVLRYFGSIVKNPLTEGLEEITQGIISGASVDYYEDILSTRASNELLYGPIAGYLNKVNKLDESEGLLDFAAGVGNSIFNTIGNKFGDEHARKELLTEGAIGAVMGGLGIPVLKRNSKGKLRPKMAGGIWDDVRDINKYRKDRSEALNFSNEIGKTLDDITIYNLDRAKLMEKLNRRDDLAVLTGDELALLENQQHKIFNFVNDAKNKGVESYLQESLDAIDEMSFEEYSKRFNKNTEEFTEEDMKKEKQRSKEDFANWINAYDVVYKGLNTESMKNSRITSKMVDMLVHSVGMEKYINREIEDSKTKLRDLGFLGENDLSEDELNEILNSRGEYKQAIENFEFLMKDKMKAKKEMLLADLDSSEKEFNSIVDALPTQVKDIALNYIKDNEEILKNATDENDKKAKIDALKTKLITDLKGENYDVNGTTVLDLLNKVVTSKNTLNKKIYNLEPDRIRQAIIDENDPDHQEAKEILENEIKEINENIKEKHDIIKEKLSNEEKLKQYSLSELIKLIEESEKYNNLVKKFNLKRQFNITLEEKFDKNVVDVESELDKIEVLYAKKMAALNLAADLLNVSPNKALHKTATMEFDATFKEFILSASSLQYEYGKLKEDDIETDALIIKYAHLKDLLNKVKIDKQALIDDFGIEEKAFRKYYDPKIRLVENMLSEIERIIINKDELEKIVNEELEKEKENETTLIRQHEELKKEKEEEEKRKKNNQSNNKQSKKNKTDSEENEDENQDEDNDDEEILDDEEDNETSKNKYPKKFNYTIYPKKPLEGQQNSLDSSDNRPLHEKVNDGTIQNGQGVSLEAALDGYELTQDFIDHLGKIGVSVDNFIKGKKEFETYIAEDRADELLDINNLSDNLKDYIINARIYFTIYDTKVKFNEDNKPVLDLENADEIHKMYFYGPYPNTDPRNKIKTKKQIEGYQRLISQVINEKEVIKKRIISEHLNDEGKLTILGQKKLDLIDIEVSKTIENFNEKIKAIDEDANFQMNFSLRVRALTQSLIGDRKVLMRVGNFLNGQIQPSISEEIGSVYSYNLLPIDGNKDNLIDSIEDITFDNLVYVDQEKNLRYYNKKEVILDEYSSFDKKYGNTNESYFIYTTINGQKIPVKLNRQEYKYNEEISEALYEVFEHYFTTTEPGSDKRPEYKLKLEPSHILYPFNGMTLKQFSENFFMTRKGSDLITGFKEPNLLTVNNNGELVFGANSRTIKNGKYFLEQKDYVKNFIGSTRAYLNFENLFNKDKTLTEIGRFMFNNNLITHTFNTSNEKTNRDKIFLKETVERDSIPFQIYDIETPKGVRYGRKKTKTKSQLDLLNKILGRRKDKAKYSIKESDIEMRLARTVLRALNKDENADVKQILIDELKKLQSLINEYNRSFGQITEITNLFTNTNLDDVDNINTLSIKFKNSKKQSTFDSYIYWFLKSVSNNIKDQKKLNKTISNLRRNARVPVEIREILYNDSSTIELSGIQTITDTKDKTKKKVKGINSSTTKDINKLLQNKSEEEKSKIISEEINKHKNVLKSLSQLRLLLTNTVKLTQSMNKFGDSNLKYFGINGHFTGVKDDGTEYASNSDNNKIIERRVTSDGEVISKNNKGQVIDAYDYTFFEGSAKIGKNNITKQPIAFYIVNNSGNIVETQNPEKDFKYDEKTGELLNGLVVVTVNESREVKTDNGSITYTVNPLDFVYMKGTDVSISQIKSDIFVANQLDFENKSKKASDSNNLRIIKSLNIPGINQDLEIEDGVKDPSQNNFKKIERLNSEVNKLAIDYKNSISSKDSSLMFDNEITQLDPSKLVTSSDSNFDVTDSFYNIELLQIMEYTKELERAILGENNESSSQIVTNISNSTTSTQPKQNSQPANTNSNTTNQTGSKNTKTNTSTKTTNTVSTNTKKPVLNTKSSFTVIDDNSKTEGLKFIDKIKDFDNVLSDIKNLINTGLKFTNIYNSTSNKTSYINFVKSIINELDSKISTEEKENIIKEFIDVYNKKYAKGNNDSKDLSLDDFIC